LPVVQLFVPRGEDGDVPGASGTSFSWVLEIVKREAKVWRAVKTVIIGKVLCGNILEAIFY